MLGQVAFGNLRTAGDRDGAGRCRDTSSSCRGSPPDISLTSPRRNTYVGRI